MGRTSGDLAQRAWPEALQDTQDALSRSLGVPLLFATPAGLPLTACEDLTQYCRRFTRQVALSRPCLGCGRGEQLEDVVGEYLERRALEPQVHLCPLGVGDASAPVVSAGETMGYLVTAQVRLSAAEAVGEDEQHTALLGRLSAVPRARLEELGLALGAVASLVGALGAARLRNQRMAERVRELSRRLQQETRTDAVTGVANRPHFCATLEVEMERARRYHRPVSLAVLDVEGFRAINEQFGHDVGDAALRALAQSIASTIRRVDAVGRVGGDELAILFPETERHEALPPLARIRAQLEDLNASGELPVEVRVSVGLVERTAHSEDLLKEALEGARLASSVEELLG